VEQPTLELNSRFAADDKVTGFIPLILPETGAPQKASAFASWVAKTEFRQAVRRPRAMRGGVIRARLSRIPTPFPRRPLPPQVSLLRFDRELQGMVLAATCPAALVAFVSATSFVKAATRRAARPCAVSITGCASPR
jgi:hypothetical protein